MIYTIENEFLKVDVSSQGAELYSLYSKVTKREYLWQGNPEFWKDRAINLFPFIGRMYEGHYFYEGKRYEGRAHGLARYFPFTLESQTENSLTFLFTDDEDTHKEYPFAFEFRVTFLLNGYELTTQYEVTNVDSRELLCAFGGHPGINIPFGKGKFEDYYLEFPKKTAVKRQLLDATNSFMADEAIDYPMVDGVKIPLEHHLFDHDAVILENTCGEVAIKSDKEEAFVRMQFHDYPFIGFWHAPKDGTPYVCLEPWSALPAVVGKVVELESKPHMTKVPVGKTASKRFTLVVHEG